MFGFGIDKGQVAHLAGMLRGLEEAFTQSVMTVATERGVIPTQYGNKNLAIIYGFANAGADHMGYSDKVMLRALEEYFCAMPNGARWMLKLMKIYTDPDYKPVAAAAFQTALEVNRVRDLTAPMRRLAYKFLTDEI